MRVHVRVRAHSLAGAQQLQRDLVRNLAERIRDGIGLGGCEAPHHAVHPLRGAPAAEGQAPQGLARGCAVRAALLGALSRRDALKGGAARVFFPASHGPSRAASARGTA